MTQKTLRFKIHQDGSVEETVEGFTGNSCNEATKNLENALGKVTVKNKTSDAFISNPNENLNKLNNTFQESFVDECTKIALFDKEPSVMEEAKTALDSMGMQGFYN